MILLISFPVDPCDGLTCKNGGTKIVSGTTCQCTCRDGFSGSFCEGNGLNAGFSGCF